MDGGDVLDCWSSCCRRVMFGIGDGWGSWTSLQSRDSTFTQHHSSSLLVIHLFTWRMCLAMAMNRSYRLELLMKDHDATEVSQWSLCSRSGIHITETIEMFGSLSMSLSSA